MMSKLALASVFLACSCVIFCTATPAQRPTAEQSGRASSASGASEEGGAGQAKQEQATAPQGYGEAYGRGYGGEDQQRQRSGAEKHGEGYGSDYGRGYGEGYRSPERQELRPRGGDTDRLPRNVHPQVPAPPGTYEYLGSHEGVGERLLDTRTGQVYKLVGGNWQAVAPPVQPNLSQGRIDLQRRILKLEEQLEQLKEEMAIKYRLLDN